MTLSIALAIATPPSAHALPGVPFCNLRGRLQEVYPWHQSTQQHEPWVVLYRGMNVRLSDLHNPNAALDLDNPRFNELSPQQRRDDAQKLLDQGLSLHVLANQGSLNRSKNGKKLKRLTLAVSEDLSQVILGENYGHTTLKDGGKKNPPMLGLVAEIRPKPSDPVVLARKSAPDWDYQEAALLESPDPEQVRWFLTVNQANNDWGPKKVYEILDPKKLKAEAKKWVAFGNEDGATRTRLLAEAAEELRKKGILREDPVFYPLAQSSNEIHQLDQLRFIYFPEPDWDAQTVQGALKRIHKNLDNVIKLHETALAAHAKDPKVLSHYKRVKERLLKRWEFLKDHLGASLDNVQQYEEFRKKLDLIDSWGS